MSSVAAIAPPVQCSRCTFGDADDGPHGLCRECHRDLFPLRVYPGDDAPAEPLDQVDDATIADAAWHAALNDTFDFDGPFPGEPQLPLNEWVRMQAAYFRSMDCDAAALVAEHLDKLANGIEACSAATPDQYRDRIEVLDGMAADDLFDRGVSRGLELADSIGF